MAIGDIMKVMEDMDHGVYNFCRKGKCSCCGACCTNILPMTEQEVNDIKEFLKTHPDIKPHNYLVAPAVAQMDLTCPFLDETKEKKCMIYEVRPRICRDFICDPKQRKHFDVKNKIECKYFDVRKAVLGSEE